MAHGSSNIHGHYNFILENYTWCSVLTLHD